MQSASDVILSTAAREIGYHEGKGKHNKFGEWYGMDGVAWCMEFVQWVYHQSGLDLPFKTASCGDLLRWYVQNQPECVTDKPVPGCVVIFDFPKTPYKTDHTGIFVQLDGDRIVTIDGNTSGGSNSNGGWVQQRTRTLEYANPVFIVPKCLTDYEEEDEVKRYNNMEEIREELPWGADTVQKLIDKKIILGNFEGLDLTEDMIRMMVYNDRAGLYKE